MLIYIYDELFSNYYIGGKVMKKRFLSSVLAVACAASLLTACGETKESPEEKVQETVEETDVKADVAENEGEDKSYICSEDPVTFTFFNIFDGINFNPTWEVFKKASEITNVTLENSVSKSSADETAAYNLMVSSGELADFISYNNLAELEKLGHSGGLLALNDLIDEYAPNIKEELEVNPQFRKIATSLDGQIFVIPKIQTIEIAEADFIRKDWLEKLNIEVPQTVDELYDVLYAFRNDDPNGNGEKDEVPFFSRQGNRSFNDVLNLWDAHEEFYVRDGKVTYGPMEDEFEIAMRNAVKWYSEGIIDKEWFTRGPKGRDILLGENLGGYCNDWVGSNCDYNVKLKDSIPGFNFEYIIPVENQKGERKLHTTRSGVPGWGISSTCKDPVAAIKYCDFWFSDVGSKLINYGIEGVTYEEDKDGNIHYTKNITDTDKTVLYELRTYGVQYRIGMIQDFNYEKAWITDDALKADIELQEGGYVYVPIPKLNGRLGLKYTEETENEYSKLMADIEPYTKQMIQNWVLGIEDFEKTYPEYLEKLKDLGIERAIEINQEAFEIYNK